MVKKMLGKLTKVTVCLFTEDINSLPHKKAEQQFFFVAILSTAVYTDKTRLDTEYIHILSHQKAKERRKFCES